MGATTDSEAVQMHLQVTEGPNNFMIVISWHKFKFLVTYKIHVDTE